MCRVMTEGNSRRVKAAVAARLVEAIENLDWELEADVFAKVLQVREIVTEE
jgi:hypothetical protein